MHPGLLRTVTMMVVLTGGLPGCAPQVDDVAREPGEPLPGLTPAELARFEQGKVWMERQWTEEEGLGPLYIQQGCGSCHDLPNMGGAGAEPVQQATFYDPATGCSVLEEEGGPHIQDRTTTPLSALGITAETIPPSANGYVRMEPPPLYGLGLVEALPEEAILAREDPDDADGDGISGRASRLPDGRLGRFGRKGGAASIVDFAEGAFRTDIGLTSPGHPREESLNGAPLPPGVDPVPDPEISREIIESVSDFVRFLAPPARTEPESKSARDARSRGQDIFHALGCPSCHVPTMRTGPSASEALEEKTIHLYSDMLLHDMGPQITDICGPTATPSEVMTARLMGLRFRQVLLHNGRAPDANRAILMHGGEATTARIAYEGLTMEARRYLMRFLDSL